MDHLKLVHNFEFNGVSIKNIKLEPDVQDPNHYCRTCDREFKSRLGYRGHLRTVHFILLKAIDISPSDNTASTDPNLYCNLCQTSYCNRSYLQHHIRSAHSDILPKPNNTDNYCISCKKSFKSELLYRKHCRRVHALKPTTPSCPVKHYCKICKITYKSKEIYEAHCNYHCRLTEPKSTIVNPEIVPNTANHNNDSKTCKYPQFTHKMFGVFSFSEKPVETTPDINDPNNYCCACDKTLSTKWGFRLHLQSIHSIKVPIKLCAKADNGFTVPNIDDPNNYCRVCNKTYQSRVNYRDHLRHKHKIIIRLMRAYLDPSVTDFQFNCRVCKSSFSSVVIYRKHCVQYHGMPPKTSAFIIDAHDPNYNCAMCEIRFETKVQFIEHLKIFHRERKRDKQRFPNPDATIDMFDPNFYCAVCDRHLALRLSFVVHLENVHDLTVPPVS